MINLAVSLPWWDSLDSVRKVHSNLEAASIVCFGLLVAFDSAAHVLDKNSPDRARIVAGIGLVFFWLAVGAEIVGYKYGQRNDELSGEQISSLDAKASDAAGKASKAVTDSRDAEKKSTDAVTKSDVATTSSGEALKIANGARKEADSFEKEIVSAKEQAAEAETHLAEALERSTAAQKAADAANGKLEDRSMSDAQLLAIADKLRSFHGQEYEITAYWDSPESLGLANRIYGSLQGALWKYDDAGQKGMMLGGIVGVQIWHHPNADDSAKQAAKLLIDELNANGITAYEKLQNPANPKSNEIGISVGSKR